MKSLYAACLSRLGLSLAKAAVLHNVRPDTVRSWSSGRNRVPQGAWNDLREYEARIMTAVAVMRAKWEEYGSPPIEINDAEADGLSVMRTAAFVLASTGEVRIGETSATRLARQARRPN